MAADGVKAGAGILKGLMLTDTDPKVERLQLDPLRQAGPAKRFEPIADLTDTVIALSLDGIARANSRLSELERRVRLWSLRTARNQRWDFAAA